MEASDRVAGGEAMSTRGGGGAPLRSAGSPRGSRRLRTAFGSGSTWGREDKEIDAPCHSGIDRGLARLSRRRIDGGGCENSSKNRHLRRIAKRKLRRAA